MPPCATGSCPWSQARSSRSWRRARAIVSVGRVGSPLDQRQGLEHRVVQVGGHLGPFVGADALGALVGELAAEPHDPRPGEQHDAAGRDDHRDHHLGGHDDPLVERGEDPDAQREEGAPAPPLVTTARPRRGGRCRRPSKRAGPGDGGAGATSAAGQTTWSGSSRPALRRTSSRMPTVMIRRRRPARSLGVGPVERFGRRRPAQDEHAETYTGRRHPTTGSTPRTRAGPRADRRRARGRCHRPRRPHLGVAGGSSEAVQIGQCGHASMFASPHPGGPTRDVPDRLRVIPDGGRDPPEDGPMTESPTSPRRLRRSTPDTVLAGVAGGAARYLGVDP